MDKNKFISDLKKSLHQHYKHIKEEDEILSYGIYTDGDANTIGIYYNTYEHFQNILKVAREKNTESVVDPLYYLFFMEEWKKDISISLKDKLLSELNDRLYDFHSSEYDKGNEDYKNETFDLFLTALKAFEKDILLENTRADFFLHMEVSDSWIDERMLKRISNIHSKNRFLEYQEYAKNNNQY